MTEPKEPTYIHQPRDQFLSTVQALIDYENEYGGKGHFSGPTMKGRGIEQLNLLDLDDEDQNILEDYTAALADVSERLKNNSEIITKEYGSQLKEKLYSSALQKGGKNPTQEIFRNFMNNKVHVLILALELLSDAQKKWNHKNFSTMKEALEELAVNYLKILGGGMTKK